ncbi:hypothetical protein E3Q12_02157 [Wallemia mellicola]|nr:hypothetical protein E3Q12_02157 [Wallemia mellicola]
MDPIKQELLKSGKIDPSVPQERLNQFQSGSNFKSAKDRQKELDEQRRREEEEYTKEAYKEYLDAFDDVKQSAFLRGLLAQHNSSSYSQKSQPVELNSQGKVKGKTQMDSFLQELKREQAGRGPNKPDMGSQSEIDPHSTNIYVANLPINIDEQMFGEYFSRYGPIASVKIMWPRQEDQSRFKQPGYAGFVSYMSRKDAELAVKELDGSDWQGHALKLDWGKRVRLPSRAIFEGPVKRPAMPASYYDERDSKRTRTEETINESHSTVTFDTETLNFLMSVVYNAKSHKYGPIAGFNELKMTGVQYTFLNDEHDPKTTFVHNRLQDLIPFDDDQPTNDSDAELTDEEQSEHEKLQKQKQNDLGPIARKQFEIMLRQISPKRYSIAKLMVFAIDHSESYREIVDILIKSLLNVSTPVPRKIARLHLVSDILANSAVGVSGAWRYRDEIQKHLDKVFEHLGLVRSVFPSKLSQNFFKERVEVVLRVWSELFIFPENILDSYMLKLEDNGKRAVSELKSNSTLISQQDNESISSNPITPVSDETLKPTGLKPIGKEPEEGIDGALLEDLDGAPMQDDIDGEPMQDDIDGEPMQDDIGAQPLEDEDIDGEAI